MSAYFELMRQKKSSIRGADRNLNQDPAFAPGSSAAMASMGNMGNSAMGVAMGISEQPGGLIRKELSERFGNPLTAPGFMSGNGLSDAHDSPEQKAPREVGQSQIPAAEWEADRLSGAVSSGGPDAVKAAMGARLGADFSGVRFHMDENSMDRADAMGARAYTSGLDVYFGSGGFDPGVAAHELVHTLQQGMVQGGVPTVSAPAGGVQMKPKSQEEEAAEYNRKLASLGPKAVERILSGKGGRFEKRKFEKIMAGLSGEGKAVLSRENMAMLYGAGEASRRFVMDRTLGNMVSHIKSFHEKSSPGDLGGDQQAYLDYMSTLQNDAFRAGDGGAIAEYGRLGQVLSERPAEILREGIRKEKGPKGLAAGDEGFKEATIARGAQMISQMPALMGDSISELRDYNGQFMGRLRDSMPEIFSDEEAARSFVGKSTLLRALMPMVTVPDSKRQLQSGSFALRSSNEAIRKVNLGIFPQNGKAMDDEVRALRDTVVPGFAEAGARPASSAPTQPSGPAGTSSSKERWSYRSDEIGALARQARTSGLGLDSTSADPKTMAIIARIYYDKLKEMGAGGDPEEKKRLVRMYMEAKQRLE